MMTKITGRQETGVRSQNGRRGLFLLASVFWLLTPAFGQQPQTSLAPIFAANSKYTNGVAPGYWATKGSGLTLNLSAGTARDGIGTIFAYVGGTLTMANNATNYVYLDTAASFVPATSTTAFTSVQLPLAVVVTSGGVITTITDDRTMFFAGSGSLVVDGLISGGGVVWTGLLNFTVSSATYIVSGIQYSSPQTNLTLDAADATDPRIDIIAVDDTGAAIVITGTPAPSPAAPDVDPASQLQLTFVYVAALATTPSNVTEEDIYLENTEYTMARSPATNPPWNLASTNNPFAGTKDVEMTTGASGNYVTATKPSGTIALSSYNTLSLEIRSKASWPSPKGLSIFWLNGTTPVGVAVVLKNGQFGFDSSQITAYQQIVIPVSLFGADGSLVNILKVQVVGGGATIGGYLDNIFLQGGITPPPMPANVMIWRGTWSATASYAVNDVVQYSGSTFIALLANTNVTPVAGATWASIGGGGGTPGGVDKNVQYNNATAFGGVANNTTATHKYLEQHSTATPVFEQPACANLSDSAGGCTMSTTAGGDLSGTLPSPTVAKVNAVAYPTTGSSFDSLPILTASNVIGYYRINGGSDCGDGTHALKYTQSTHLIECQTVTGSSTLNFADNEVPSGSINGSNVTFTLAHTPSPAASLSCYLNGLEQRAAGADFTLATATITYVSAPLTGDTLVCSYRY